MQVIQKYPNLGVQIIKLQSKFEGNWYCGKNKEILKGVKRPYYIWIIGDKHILARMNREAPCGEILGGIDSYCAFATAGIVPFDMGKKSFIAKPNRPVKVPVFVDLACSLQDESVLQDVGRYSLEHPGQVRICRITPVTEKRNKYSHVLNLEITNPKTIKSETISFSCPNLPSWVVESNDDTGVDVKKNINKTTGILYLVKGVAEAYKNQLTYGTVSFNMRNK